MRDSVPKSRVTLTYDTRQPEGREKPRELPFRLLVLGDVGGDKSAPLDHRKVRQLNGRNLGEVIKGLKIRVRDIALDGERKLDVLIDSMSSFSPDDILKLLTGQKAEASRVDPMLQSAWGTGATAKELWPGDSRLIERWADRGKIASFQKSYQNSKTLRAALKRFSAPPAENDVVERNARKDAIALLKALGPLAAEAQRLADVVAKTQKASEAVAKEVAVAEAKKKQLDEQLKLKPNDDAAKKLADAATPEVTELKAKAQKLAAEAQTQKLAADSAKGILDTAAKKFAADAVAKKAADDTAKKDADDATKGKA